MLGLMQSRKVESEATMSALKAKRQQTAAQLNQHEAGPERSEGPDQTQTALGSLAAKIKSPHAPNSNSRSKKPSGGAVSRTRKFVASEEELAAASDDFSEAVGGAKEGGDAKPIVTAAMRKSEKPQDQGPTTSRLLDAKRKAQERMKDQEK
jgi:hypothetical protein